MAEQLNYEKKYEKYKSKYMHRKMQIGGGDIDHLTSLIFNNVQIIHVTTGLNYSLYKDPTNEKNTWSDYVKLKFTGNKFVDSYDLEPTDDLKRIVNNTNSRGQTPLYLAARYMNIEIINLLLDVGANINQLNQNKDTPLHGAAWGCNWNNITECQKILKLLKEKGADINARNSNNETAQDLLSMQLSLSNL